MLEIIFYIIIGIGLVSIIYRKLTNKSIDDLVDEIFDKSSDLLKSKKIKVEKKFKSFTETKQIFDEPRTIWMHITHTKGRLYNNFEEGYEIPFFDGAEKGVEQRAQLHILYEIELPSGFDEDEDDPLIHIDWECIMGLYYIDGYLEETNPDECFILGIDEDDYRNIESDNCYQWNGLGKDDSLVSKATSLDAALELFEDYISKYAKGRKDKF